MRLAAESWVGYVEAAIDLGFIDRIDESYLEIEKFWNNVDHKLKEIEWQAEANKNMVVMGVVEGSVISMYLYLIKAVRSTNKEDMLECVSACWEKNMEIFSDRFKRNPIDIIPNEFSSFVSVVYRLFPEEEIVRNFICSFSFLFQNVGGCDSLIGDVELDLDLKELNIWG